MSVARDRYRRAVLRWLGGLLAGAVGLPLQAAPTSAERQSLQRAQRRMDALEALADQVHTAHSAAVSLEGHARATETAWQQVQASEADARQALQRATEAQPALRRALATPLAALVALPSVVARSHQAVRELALATPQQLPAAAAAADAAFLARDQAERSLRGGQQALVQQLALFRQQVELADQAVEKVLASLRLLGERAARLEPNARRVQSEWQGVLSREQQAAQQAGWQPRAPVLPAPATAAQRALGQALQGVPSSGLASDLAPLQALARPDADLMRLADVLLRLQDAEAYLTVVAGRPGETCEPQACRVLVSDIDALRKPMASAGTALRAAESRFGAAARALDGLQALQQDRMAQAAVLVQTVSLPVGQAIEDARGASAAVLVRTRELQPAAESQLERARSEWAAAYRKVYGKSPAELLGKNMPQGRFQAQARSESASPTARQIDLRGHAYALFATRQGEPAGFGAYTYVLLRSGADLQQPAVRQRLVQVLDIVRRQARASDVPANLTPRVNLFCVPNRLADDPDAQASAPTAALADGYLADLGQQLLVRAQSGLLTRTEVCKRLTSAPGPFLLTLPGRIGESSSGTPLLLADLSDYPEAAIADLVTHYMNGLVDDFPQKQELWRPSVLQSVALAVIYLPQQAGQVLTSVVPATMASPPSR